MVINRFDTRNISSIHFDTVMIYLRHTNEHFTIIIMWNKKSSVAERQRDTEYHLKFYKVSANLAVS